MEAPSWGLIAAALGVGGIGSFFDIGTWLIAIGGALLLLVIYSTLIGSRPTTTDPAEGAR